MDVSVVVPLPISVADNTAAAFLPLVAQPPLVRIVRTLLGAVAEPGRIVVAAAEPLIDDVRAAPGVRKPGFRKCRGRRRVGVQS